MISAVLWKSYELGWDQSLSWTAWLQSRHYAKGEREKPLPFWTEFISKAFLISGLYMEEIPSSNSKEVRCQKVVNLNAKPLMLIPFIFEWTRYQNPWNWEIPQIRKFRIRRDKQLFFFSFSLFLLSESCSVLLDLAKEETKRSKLINLFTHSQWHYIEWHLKWLI